MNATGLKLVKREPPAHLVEEPLDSLVLAEEGQFADNLQAARVLWRRFRELVEAPVFPEQLRAGFIDKVGWPPEEDGEDNFGEKVLVPGFRETQRPRAIELVREWMLKERRNA